MYIEGFIKKRIHLIIIVALLSLTNCKGNVKSNTKDNIKQELFVENDEPLIETISCKFYCNLDSAEMLIDQGYILTGVSFDPKENIPYGETIPFTPKKGTKKILFIHFQPNFEKIENGDCPSSNLVIFLELESLQNGGIRKISKNIQFALFTGGPFYRFETNRETKGEIQITNRKKGIVEVKLKLDFGLVEENITSLELHSKLSIINQEEMN